MHSMTRDFQWQVSQSPTPHIIMEWIPQARVKRMIPFLDSVRILYEALTFNYVHLLITAENFHTLLE